jgi:hypothetical protein
MTYRQHGNGVSRLLVLGLVLALIAGSSLFLLPSPRAATYHGLHDLRVPAGDPNWQTACQSAILPDVSRRCTSAAVFDLNLARPQEGLPRLTLPAGLLALTQAKQLQYLINNERAIRNLPTVSNSTNQLERLAFQAAVDARDPTIPTPLVGGSDWAGNFPNAVVVDFMWMYEDGYTYTNGGGGSNLDCQSPKASGCWGHREVILEDSSTSTHYGTAFTTNLAPSQSLQYADSFTLILAGQQSPLAPPTARPLARLVGIVAIIMVGSSIIRLVTRRRRNGGGVPSSNS